MDPYIIGLLISAGLIGLIALGLPIGAALLGMGGIGVLLTSGARSAEYILAGLPHSATGQLGLITIPLFLFMGHMAFSAGITRRAFEAARIWVGGLPGGLPVATVFACAGFAAVSGSSIATAATVSRIAIPEMLKAGYSGRLAGACVAAAGTLGVLIPPSSILIIYSIATQTPLSELFLAAFIPGILTAVVYAAGIMGMVGLGFEKPSAGAGQPTSFTKKLRSFGLCWEVIVLFCVVMVPLYTGLATATETAAFGAAAALVLAFVRGKDRMRTMWRGMVATGASSASIMMLIMGSALFSTALATSQIPQMIASQAAALELSPVAMLLLLLLPYLVLGCFIDGISMIFLTMPIVFPIIEHYEINPILFGILLTKTIEIGAISPPIGVNVFVVCGQVKDLRVTDVFRGVVPFIVIELVIIGLLVTFPQLASS